MVGNKDSYKFVYFVYFVIIFSLNSVIPDIGVLIFWEHICLSVILVFSNDF